MRDHPLALILAAFVASLLVCAFACSTYAVTR